MTKSDATPVALHKLMRCSPGHYFDGENCSGLLSSMSMRGVRVGNKLEPG